MIKFLKYLFEPYAPKTRGEKLYRIENAGHMKSLLEAISNEHHSSQGVGVSNDNNISVVRVGSHQAIDIK